MKCADCGGEARPKVGKFGYAPWLCASCRMAHRLIINQNYLPRRRLLAKAKAIAAERGCGYNDVLAEWGEKRSDRRDQRPERRALT